MSPDITKVLSQICRERGLRQVGSEWHRDGDGIVHITRTIKSRYGGQRYVDIGVKDIEFIPEDSRLKDDWHLQARLDELFPNRLEVLSLLDADSDLDDSFREREIRLQWERVEQIFFSRFSSSSLTRDYVREHGLTRYPILVFYYYGKFVDQL